MARKKLPPDLKYNIPEDIKNYGSWDYLQSLPRYDANYFKIFLQKYGSAYARQKNLDANSAVKNYFNQIKYDTDEYKELAIKFDSLLAENPWIQEFYNFCLEKSGYVTDPFDVEGHWISLQSHHNHYSQAEKEKAERALNFFKQKLDFSRFNMICGHADNQLLFYNEIKRDIPFVIGNIVRLRKKYIQSRNHDPFYRKRELKDEERIGHITAVLNDTHNSSYNGKGSRLVEVYWAASGETNKQSVGSLKLLDQKNNKMVDKLVDE